ncbi:MAG: heterodisulfide reductase-related iron-sulfur binding cluster [Candidatus Methanomethylicia archaeon]|nr:heterodisulfide reductase-related iron-sulfur binding cluster [Candidatus Methanomethylicia archaeon]
MADRLLYWKGCMSRLKVKGIADSTMELLDLMGIRYDTLGGDEGCCGSILLRTGYPEEAKKLVRLNISQIGDAGYTKMVTSCPGCYRTFASEYPKMIAADLPFNVQHISQLLSENLGALRNKLKPLKMDVVYHDPCHLGRHMGIYEEPRRLIKAIPGIRLAEFRQNRSLALCCGSGGGVRSALPDVSTAVAKSIIDGPLGPLGVRAIITACPFCYYNFNTAGGVEVIDLPQLLLRSCKGERSNG